MSAAHSEVEINISNWPVEGKVAAVGVMSSGPLAVVGSGLAASGAAVAAGVGLLLASAALTGGAVAVPVLGFAVRKAYKKAKRAKKALLRKE